MKLAAEIYVKLNLQQANKKIGLTAPLVVKILGAHKNRNVYAKFCMSLNQTGFMLPDYMQWNQTTGKMMDCKVTRRIKRNGFRFAVYCATFSLC